MILTQGNFDTYSVVTEALCEQLLVHTLRYHMDISRDSIVGQSSEMRQRYTLVH